MERLRLFVALELPPEIKQAVARVQTRIQAAQQQDAVRWAKPEGTHITLKYLGETELAPTIKQALDPLGPLFQPFTLTTAPTGVFPNARQPRIVWLGVGGDLAALHQVQQAVEQTIAPLGFPTEQRPFTPHITLGRTRANARLGDVARLGPVVQGIAEPIKVREWQVDHMVLMLSQSGPEGVAYTPIHSVRFDAH